MPASESIPAEETIAAHVEEPSSTAEEIPAPALTPRGQEEIPISQEEASAPAPEEDIPVLQEQKETLAPTEEVPPPAPINEVETPAVIDDTPAPPEVHFAQPTEQPVPVPEAESTGEEVKDEGVKEEAPVSGQYVSFGLLVSSFDLSV